MDVVTVGPLPASSLVWQPRPGAWVLTVVAKATFLLKPGEVALAPLQEAPTADDRYHGDDRARSVQRPRDLVPAKPLADVVLVGQAFAADRRPVRSLLARLAVGEIDKTIEVVADRRLGPGGKLLEGAPFAQMPLTYERTAGGPGTWNPVGVARGVRDAEGRVVLPNIVRPNAPQGTHEPVGFGPIAPSWPERADRLGAAGAGFSFADLATRPLPEGMDLGYFNAAPRDQQLRTLSPTESIVLEHLHPEHARLATRLPGILARASLEGRKSGSVEIAMRPDTLWFDTERGICTLSFRGMVPLESANEQGRVVVAMGRAQAEMSGVFRAPSGMPEVVRPAPHLACTADISVAFRKAALPFAPGAATEVREPSGPQAPAAVAPAPQPPQIGSPWTSGAPFAPAPQTPPDSRVVQAPRIIEAPPTSVLSPRGSAVPGVLDASNAAAGATAPRAVQPAPSPRPLPEAEPQSTPRPEVREAIDLIWFDPECVPRMRRKPAWRPILDQAEKTPGDADLDDPALAKDPMAVEDRREIFDILARGEPMTQAALDDAQALCQRDDGKFVPTLALFAGELEMPFDELATLRATIGTVTPLVGADEALRGTLDTAKELLALPDLVVSTAVAEGLTRRIDQAFSQGKRAVPSDYVETQRERALLEQRRYQRRAVFGDRHLRGILRFDAPEAAPPRPVGGKAPPTTGAVPVYLPESTAAMLPLSARFRVRFIAEVRLSTDPTETHPLALKVVALARTVPAAKR